MSKEKIYIFDTTLRDGAQTEGVNFSIDDKNKIARALSNLGVDYLEGGWPGANTLDTTFFNNPPNYSLEIFQISTHEARSSNWALLVSEIIATGGLILTILFVRKSDPKSVAAAVALFITAGYWFTSSTSFANPMVTISRIFTNTFTGISPSSVPYFLVGQLIVKPHDLLDIGIVENHIIGRIYNGY